MYCFFLLNQTGTGDGEMINYTMIDKALIVWYLSCINNFLTSTILPESR